MHYSADHPRIVKERHFGLDAMLTIVGTPDYENQPWFFNREQWELNREGTGIVVLQLSPWALLSMSTAPQKRPLLAVRVHIIDVPVISRFTGRYVESIVLTVNQVMR